MTNPKMPELIYLGRLFRDGAYTDERRWVRAEDYEREVERLTKLYDSAVAGRHAFRQMHIRSRNALRRAVEWAAPMAEAPPDARPEWFDIASAALAGEPPSPAEPSAQPRRCKSMHTVQCVAEVGHAGDHLHNLVGWRDQSPLKSGAKP